MLLHKSMSLPRKGSENWTCNQIALGCLCAIEAASRPKGFKSKNLYRTHTKRRRMAIPFKRILQNHCCDQGTA